MLDSADDEGGRAEDVPHFDEDYKPFVEVYEIGPTTILGFGGRDALDNVNLAACRDEIIALVDNNDVSTLAFDLTGVRLIPSGLLGLLASLRQHNVDVHLYNPSPDVREVLEVTHLDELMPVHEVEVTRSAES